MNKAIGGWAVRLFLVAISLFLIFSLTNVQTVLQNLARVQTVPILAAFLFFVVRQPIAVLRWEIILSDMGIRMSFTELLRLSMMSLFFGLLLPSANGNDVARGVLMRRSGGHWSVITASILLDRFYGVISLLLLVLPGGTLLILRGAGHGIVLAFVLASAALLGSLLLLLPGARFLRPRPDAAGGGFSHHVMTALRLLLHGLRRPRSSLLCLLLSLAAQIVAVASTWCASISTGFDIPFDVYLTFVPIIWLVTALPITFLGIGLREATFAALFAAIGIPMAHGISIGLLNSAIAIAGSLFGGLAYLLPSRT